MMLAVLQSRSGLLWWHKASLTPFCNIPDFGSQEANNAEQSDLPYNNISRSWAWKFQQNSITLTLMMSLTGIMSMEIFIVRGVKDIFDHRKRKPRREKCCRRRNYLGINETLVQNQQVHFELLSSLAKWHCKSKYQSKIKILLWLLLKKTEKNIVNWDWSWHGQY